MLIVLGGLMLAAMGASFTFGANIAGLCNTGVNSNDTKLGSSIKPSVRRKDGGAYRIRTCDPHNAIVVLYQLS
jgi:hypothetical protein